MTLHQYSYVHHSHVILHWCWLVHCFVETLHHLHFRLLFWLLIYFYSLICIFTITCCHNILLVTIVDSLKSTLLNSSIYYSMAYKYNNFVSTNSRIVFCFSLGKTRVISNWSGSFRSPMLWSCEFLVGGVGGGDDYTLLNFLWHLLFTHLQIPGVSVMCFSEKVDQALVVKFYYSLHVSHYLQIWPLSFNLG